MEARRHFDRWAERYDRSPVQAWLRALQEEAARRVRLPPVGGILLDVGCGTGSALLLARLVHPGAATLGVDLSTNMLRAARRKGLPRLVAGAAEALPLRSASVNAILCTASFHHYPDPESAAREFHRVLKPGGEAHVLDPSVPRVVMRALEFAVHRVPFRGRRVHGAVRLRRVLRDAGFGEVRTRWTGVVGRHTIARKASA